MLKFGSNARFGSGLVAGAPGPNTGVFWTETDIACGPPGG
jgi:hypothetical protein